MIETQGSAGGFPKSAGILFGLSLDGFFDGIVLHHVNELVPQGQRVYWDIAFLAWGGAMLAGGWAMMRAGQRETRKAP